MPDTTAAPPDSPTHQGPIWEVFVQEKAGAPHEHAGSLHAPDREMALQNARDVYSRRGGVCSIWVVPTEFITASTPDDSPMLFEAGSVASKPYRHPQFYKVPKAIRQLDQEHATHD
ncbi:MAG: 1,2-phenylacetyl-CoA epoxidase subunit PaaB [Planctomycetota bacterium]